MNACKSWGCKKEKTKPSIVVLRGNRLGELQRLCKDCAKKWSRESGDQYEVMVFATEEEFEVWRIIEE